MEAPGTTGVAGAMSMTNTKAEIVAAAVADGYGTSDELDAMTKSQLLALWN